MRKELAGAAILLSGAMGLAAQGTAVTVTGFIMDTLCGSKGANHLHAEHARRSVVSGKAQYTLRPL